MKKSIMIFIMLIFCFINTNVYGAESVPEIEEQEITQIEISHEKILLATEKDVCDAISRIFATEKQFSYQEETLATVEYFLKTFSEATYKQFIHFHEGAWLYIAEDTTWLSKEEWDYLTRNLKRPIPLDMVNIIVQRTMNAREYLQNNHDIQNHSQFADIIHNFYPEFSEFIEGSDDAIRFWLSGDETETGIFTIQIALHEWQH